MSSHLQVTTATRTQLTFVMLPLELNPQMVDEPIQVLFIVAIDRPETATAAKNLCRLRDRSLMVDVFLRLDPHRELVAAIPRVSVRFQRASLRLENLRLVASLVPDDLVELVVLIGGIVILGKIDASSSSSSLHTNTITDRLHRNSIVVMAISSIIPRHARPLGVIIDSPRQSSHIVDPSWLKRFTNRRVVIFLSIRIVVSFVFVGLLGRFHFSVVFYGSTGLFRRATVDVVGEFLHGFVTYVIRNSRCRVDIDDAGLFEFLSFFPIDRGSGFRIATI